MKPNRTAEFSQLDLKLAEALSQFYADPLGFVKFMYPWGEPGPLQHYTGPDTWQTETLIEIGEMVRARGFNGVDPVAPILKAVSSGHGVGKGVMVGWLVCWILSTRPGSQGTVTANSHQQLKTKTWASIQRWLRRSLVPHWFDIGQEIIRHKLYPETWFVQAQSCKEENSESFAGQHAADSTSYYVFDEASSIPNKIWEVAEGGLTDGEPMHFAFGNPTRNSGRFYDICFGRGRDRWHPSILDSRTSRFTNKELFKTWEEEYGEDSDFFRVRVRGLAPRQSDAQFIGQDVVWAAQGRRVEVLPDEPLVAGLDVARGGGDNCVIRFRQGLDAATLAPIRIPFERSRDSMHVVSVAQDLLSRDFACKTGPQPIKILFVDETGIGGPIVDRLHQLGFDQRVVGVQFGGKAPDPQMDNMRAHMWNQMRGWLAKGSIDKDPILETDLGAPGYGHNKRGKLVLEAKESMKKRGAASPDDGDALCLCFAASVVKASMKAPVPPASFAANDRSGLGWMA